MTDSASIFNHHYAQYLKQLETLELNRVAQVAGAEFSTETSTLLLTYFNRVYRVSARGIYTEKGDPAAYETCAILSRYLIMAGHRLETGQDGRGTGWTGFRDLKDSGPLTVYFQDNVESAICRLLTGRAKAAARELACLAPERPTLDARYELMLAFQGLPNIPLLMLFNDAEEGFPAGCSVLFRSDVAFHLDAECIAMMGYELAARIRQAMGGTRDLPGR